MRRLAPEPRTRVSVVDKGDLWGCLEQEKVVFLGGYL